MPVPVAHRVPGGEWGNGPEAERALAEPLRENVVSGAGTVQPVPARGA